MIGVSDHAVERFQERVKPALDLDAARTELEALVRAAEKPSSEQPNWHVKAVPCSLYLHLSDGIACTVKDETVTSVLTRASEAPDAKAAKKREKKKRQAERRVKRHHDSRPGRMERRQRRERATWD